MRVYNKNDVDVTFSDWLTDLEQLISFDAIPLAKVKQAREEIDNLYEDFDGYGPYALCEYSSRVDEILNKLIESEDKE